MKRKNRTKTVVHAAIMGALALVFLYLGSMLPAWRWGITAVAGLMPAAAVIAAGLPSGLLCWLGSSVLAVFLIPDKLAVLLFAVLFGLYAVAKCLIERMRRLVFEYILKLLFFNAAFTLVFFLMKAAVLDSLPTELHAVWLIYAVGNVVFLIYDYGFTKLIGLYLARVYKASR